MKCDIYSKLRNIDPFIKQERRRSSKLIMSYTNLTDDECEESPKSALKNSKECFTKEYNETNLSHLKTYDHEKNLLVIISSNVPALKKIKTKSKNKHKLLKEYCHMQLFYHPPRRTHIDIDNENKYWYPFSFEADFAKMHAIDLRNENPLDGLDLKVQLKELIQEIIDNDQAEVEGIDIYDDELKLFNSIKYPTSNELDFLEYVEEKMKCERHKKLGYPLSIVEMCAIIIYTNTSVYIPFCKDQRKGILQSGHY